MILNRASLKLLVFVLLVVILLLLVVFPVVLESSSFNVWLFVRLAALLGATCLLLAAISSAMVKAVYRLLKRPFIRVHHVFAVLGGVFIITHVSLIAWQSKSLAVLVPVLDSWQGFLVQAGRPALILIILATVFALLLKKIPAYWRRGHWLMYPAIALGAVHAFKLGQDIRNPFIAGILGIMLVFASVTFFYKRANSMRSGNKTPNST